MSSCGSYTALSAYCITRTPRARTHARKRTHSRTHIRTHTRAHAHAHTGGCKKDNNAWGLSKREDAMSSLRANVCIEPLICVKLIEAYYTRAQRLRSLSTLHCARCLPSS